MNVVKWNRVVCWYRTRPLVTGSSHPISLRDVGHPHWEERRMRLRRGFRQNAGSLGFAQDGLFDCGLRPSLRMTDIFNEFQTRDC